MIGSTLVCQRTLQSSSQINNESIGFIYASHFGEIESSTQYLYDLKTDQMAKPILFQNSLHNSALGFVSIDLKLKGPALTVSGGRDMNQCLVDTAEGLFFMCDQLLICMSDSIPEKYQHIYSETFPDLNKTFNQSRSFLLSKTSVPFSEFVHLHDLKFI